MKTLRNAALCALVGLLFVAGGVVRASADDKSEMVAVMDKLCAGGPDAEAQVDWDNFQFHAPQLHNMDIHKMYAGYDAANKKAFRTSFCKSFASSYKQSSKGHTFAEVAKVKGALTFGGTKDHPTMSMGKSAAGPSGAFQVGYSRKHGKLLIQSLTIPGK